MESFSPLLRGKNVGRKLLFQRGEVGLNGTLPPPASPRLGELLFSTFSIFPHVYGRGVKSFFVMMELSKRIIGLYNQHLFGGVLIDKNNMIIHTTLNMRNIDCI